MTPFFRWGENHDISIEAAASGLSTFRRGVNHDKIVEAAAS